MELNICFRWRKESLDQWCHGLERTLFMSTFDEILTFMVSTSTVTGYGWISYKETKWTPKPKIDTCTFRTILDLYHSGVCHCHQWKHLQLSGTLRKTRLYIYPRVSKRLVLLFGSHLSSWNVRGLLKKTFLISGFNVFSSDYSCSSDLQLCLLGAPCPLGFLAMEKQ